MTTKFIGIIVNGATGGIATRQHLESSLVAIRDEGRLNVAGEYVVPRLLLVGRNEERLAETARRFAVEEWTTSLDDALANPDYSIFFDAAATGQRKTTLTRAIEAGKHVYSEKPVAPTVAEGLELLELAKARGVKHGAVEDKLNLPGLRKLSYLLKQGFFGQILHFRLVFGWWVFAGDLVEGQRPSWNYKSSGGGGLILDMHPHWRYVIEGTLGRISRLVASAWTAIPERFDESGSKYAVDVEDSTSVQVELENGVHGSIFGSWATRVRLDEPLSIHVDGTHGSAVAGLHRCHIQLLAQTPDVAWSPNVDPSHDHRTDWTEVPDLWRYPNSYRVGWEGFIRHVLTDAPFASNLSAGIRDVMLAEACYLSANESRWVDLREFE